MKRNHLFYFLIGAAFIIHNVQAQDSIQIIKPKTVSMEVFVGDNRQFIQILVNKVFAQKKKIGLLSITSYAADYKENLSNNEFQNTTLIYHHLFKGISIISGISFTSVEGMKNFVGLQYMYQNNTFSLVYMPGYYFINSHKISNLALIEYRPVIKNKWLLYTHLQLHYNQDLEIGKHFRSYIYSRLGLTYQYFSFGLAHNFDQYGANKTTKNNYGVFLRLAL